MMANLLEDFVKIAKRGDYIRKFMDIKSNPTQQKFIGSKTDYKSLSQVARRGSREAGNYTNSMNHNLYNMDAARMSMDSMINNRGTATMGKIHNAINDYRESARDFVTEKVHASGLRGVQQEALTRNIDGQTDSIRRYLNTRTGNMSGAASIPGEHGKGNFAHARFGTLLKNEDGSNFAHVLPNGDVMRTSGLKTLNIPSKGYVI